MSDAFFSQLPRFHPATDRQPADWLRVLTSPEATSAHKPETPAPTSAAAAAAPVEVAPAASPAALQASLEAGVTTLATLVTRLEAEARAEAAKTIRALAGELLPELSRHFLADEIMRHLPGLVPVSAAQFEIRAAPEVAERIGELAEQHPALAGRVVVVPQPDYGASADISWRSGGVTFEFDSLLSACLARLNATSSQIME